MVGIALGMLMERPDISLEGAFGFRRRASSLHSWNLCAAAGELASHVSCRALQRLEALPLLSPYTADAVARIQRTQGFFETA